MFTTFSSNGWPTVPSSCLVGILAPVITLIGADSQAHLGEETRDAARVVPRYVAATVERYEWLLTFKLPRAMVATALVNYTVGFATVVVSDISERDAGPTRNH